VREEQALLFIAVHGPRRGPDELFALIAGLVAGDLHLDDRTPEIGFAVSASFSPIPAGRGTL
jgi:hypothetical protein